MDILKFLEKYEINKVEEYPHQVTSNPLVSICVQTFNHSEYIEQCLNSIINQKTNFPFEIRIGEDCSNDNTREICKRYAEKYPSIIKLFLHQRENNIKVGGKFTGRFNMLYNMLGSNAKYISFCEGDDYWIDLDKLQKQVDFLEANDDYNLVGHIAIDSDNRKRGVLEKDTYTFDDVYYKNIRIPTASLLFRNNLDVPDWIFEVYGGDRALIYLNALQGKLKVLPFIGSFYRIHKGGMESNLKKDKFSLPIRNINEEIIYYDLIKTLPKRVVIYNKIIKNHLYILTYSILKCNSKYFISSINSLMLFITKRRINIKY